MFLICKGSSPIYMSKATTQDAAVADYKRNVILRYQHEELIIHEIDGRGMVSDLGWIINT